MFHNLRDLLLDVLAVPFFFCAFRWRRAGKVRQFPATWILHNLEMFGACPTDLVLFRVRLGQINFQVWPGAWFWIEEALGKTLSEFSRSFFSVSPPFELQKAKLQDFRGGILRWYDARRPSGVSEEQRCFCKCSEVSRCFQGW